MLLDLIFESGSLLPDTATLAPPLIVLVLVRVPSRCRHLYQATVRDVWYVLLGWGLVFALFAGLSWLFGDWYDLLVYLAALAATCAAWRAAHPVDDPAAARDHERIP